MKYAASSTRWQVIGYDYVDGYPQSDSIVETNEVLLNEGVVSLSFGRSKDSIQSVAQIEIVGTLAKEYRIGNWIILKSKVGAFKDPTKPSTIAEGLVRFIGQVVDVQTSYSTVENGLFHRRSSVTVREWSGILHCPVRLEFGSAEQAALNSPNDVVSSNVLVKADKLNNDLIKIAESVFDPFDYVRLVLAFIGCFGSDFKGTTLQFTDPANEALAVVAEEISKSALYLPHIPQKLLTYLGMKDIKPNAAFTSKGGFAGLVLGVNNGEQEASKTYLKKNDDKTFDGRFTSFTDVQNLYKNYKDRPRTTGMFSDFAQGRGAWDIIKSRCDGEYNECFTDIWYFNNPLTEKTSARSISKLAALEGIGSKDTADAIDDKGTTYAKPVIVIRDKPFALAKYLKDANIEKTKWSTLDNVPRVSIDNVYIKNVSVKSTFYNSPNYIQPNIAADGLTDTFAQKNLVTLFALRTIRPEMNRFGGIQYFPSTPFIAIDGKNNELSSKWFSDASKVQYLWHGLNYRFLSGSMTLKDHDVAIMVGCNVVFKTKSGLTLCAHVESVSWQFMINADGSVMNDCQVSFSNMCRVLSDGSLDFIPVSLINDLFTNSIGNADKTTDDVALTRNIKKIEDKLKQKEVNKAINSASNNKKKDK